MRSMVSTIIIGAAMLCLAACGPEGNAQSSNTVTPSELSQEVSAAPASIQNVTWVLTSLDQQKVVPDSKVTLTLESNGTLYGAGGCNRYGGQYSLDGGKLEINPSIVATLMACAQELMDQEHQYHQVLGRVKTWQVDADQQLVLHTSDNGTLVFTKE